MNILFNLQFKFFLFFKYIKMKHPKSIQRWEKEPSWKKQLGTTSWPQVREKEHTPLAIRKMLQFISPTHLARYEQLWEKPFQASRFIDWDILEQVNLIEEVQQLISFSGQDTFFSIKEPVYQELTLEFLSTFNLEERHINQSFSNTIQF